jgi:hypothetical protein
MAGIFFISKTLLSSNLVSAQVAPNQDNDTAQNMTTPNLSPTSSIFVFTPRVVYYQVGIKILSNPSDTIMIYKSQAKWNNQQSGYYARSLK